MRIVLLLTLFVLCAVPLQAAEISISAAASLKEVINEISANYGKKHSEATFTANYGGSGQLAKQIENGAPADIFISANKEWMEYLTKKNRVDQKNIRPFTENVLVFAGRPQSGVTRLQDLARLDRIAIGSPKSVPAGEYAVAALHKAGMYKQLEKKLVMAKDVRECLLYAERGEVDGAFVYKTDVLQAAHKARILFVVPQEAVPPIRYPMAIITTGSGKAESAAFFTYLQSAEAKAVLARHGFTVK